MTTFTVDTNSNSAANGDDAYSGGNLAAESADGFGLTLEEAIGLAQNGDTITFDAGLSGLSIVGAVNYVISHNITIDGDLNDDGIPDITLDANGSGFGSFIGISSGVTATIDGLTITGTGSSGTTIYASSASNLTITNSVITGNAGSYTLSANGSNLSLDGVRLESNTNAGGITLGASSGTVSITDSSITGNSAVNIIQLDGVTSPTIAGSTIAQNTAGSFALQLANITGSVSLTNSVLTGNNGSAEINLGGPVAATVTDSIIAGGYGGINFTLTGQSLSFSGSNVMDIISVSYSGNYPLIENNASNIFNSISGSGGALSLHTLPSGAQIYVALVNPTGVAQGLGPAYPATIGGDTTGSIAENTATTTGVLTISDLNGASEESFQADTLAGSHGTLTLASNGDWSYALDNTDSNVDALNVGDTLTDTITISSADGTTQDIVLTINGANDDAVVSGTTTGSVTEGNVGDAAVTATGAITITDVDNVDPNFADVASTAGDNGYGSFVLSSGTWTYTLDESAVQSLNASDTVTDTHTYTATDGTTQVITVTITGADDAAVVSGTTTGAVDEGNVGDAAVTATGAISISDVDSADTPSFADVASTAGDNGYGDFVLSSGTWTYTLDESKVQSLNAGDTVTDTHTYTATDGTTQVITVSIHGTDDAAVVSGTTTGTVADGGTTTATGTLTISDVDSADTPSFADVAATTSSYGSFAMTSGTWTYTLDEAKVASLGAGSSVTDTHTFTATDGTTQAVTITIGGSDGAPTAPTLTSDGVTENQAGAYVGTLSSTDPEGGAVTFTADDDRFTVKNGDELWLKDGVSLDYESGHSVTLQVFASDAADHNTSAFVSFDVGNVVERTSTYGTANLDDLRGNAGADLNLVWARGGNDDVTGTAGNDMIGGSTGADSLSGLAGDDTLYGAADNDTLSGGAGDDLIYNGQGDDSVDGGAGDDRLWAGAGDDTLTGGDGADRFIFGAHAGNDTITDFSTSDDSLDLAYRGFANLAAVEAASSDVTQNGEAGLLIDLGNGESVFLAGLSTDDLSHINMVL